VSKPSLVIVLAEDERHQRFVRHFLYQKGLSTHQIRMEPLPSGKGCGEQWVRERYPTTVKAYRERSARARTALVVVIDADTCDADRRGRQLREAITHFVPKRNIETWVLFLDGRSVDEDKDYSLDPDVDQLIRPGAVAFFDMSRVNAAPRSNCIASLLAAIPEARRLE
jgi:hypothetical protein